VNKQTKKPKKVKVIAFLIYLDNSISGLRQNPVLMPRFQQLFCSSPGFQVEALAFMKKMSGSPEDWKFLFEKTGKKFTNLRALALRKSTELTESVDVKAIATPAEEAILVQIDDPKKRHPFMQTLATVIKSCFRRKLTLKFWH
jgi:hypothetical protein